MQRGIYTRVIRSSECIFSDAEKDLLKAGVSNAVAGNLQFSQRRVQRTEQLLKAALLCLIKRQDVVQFVIRLRF